MKYILTIFIFLNGAAVVFGQTQDSRLRQQLNDLVDNYIHYSDLSQQNTSDPNCERFNFSIADEFVSLFEGDPDLIQIPNIYSDELYGLFGKSNIKSKKVNEAQMFISLNDYYGMAQENETLKAFTYFPFEKGNLVVRIYKHQKKVSENKFQSIVGVEYEVKVCKGEESFQYSLPLRITCSYQTDTTSSGFTYPKVEKVELDGKGGTWRYDFYLTPYIEYSSGTIKFDDNKIPEFENKTNGNPGVGVLLQVRIPNPAQKLAKSLILGLGFRQINYTHSLDNLNLLVSNEIPPFQPIDGIIANYSKEIILNDIEEQSSLNLITVPLGVGLDFKIGGITSKRSIYLNPMMVFNFPIKYKSDYNSGTVDYIGQFRIAGPAQSFPLVIDDYAGFGRGFAVKPAMDDYDYNSFNFSGEIELGYKFSFSQASSLKIGCFLNQSFLNTFGNPTNSAQITNWDGKMLSYPYYSNPVKNTLFGVRVSVQNFLFQWKRNNDSIEKITVK
jgi:hypothetical protein